MCMRLGMLFVNSICQLWTYISQLKRPVLQASVQTCCGVKRGSASIHPTHCHTSAMCVAGGRGGAHGSGIRASRLVVQHVVSAQG